MGVGRRSPSSSFHFVNGVASVLFFALPFVGRLGTFLPHDRRRSSAADFLNSPPLQRLSHRIYSEAELFETQGGPFTASGKKLRYFCWPRNDRIGSHVVMSLHLWALHGRAFVGERETHIGWNEPAKRIKHSQVQWMMLFLGLHWMTSDILCDVGLNTTEWRQMQQDRVWRAGERGAADARIANRDVEEELLSSRRRTSKRFLKPNCTGYFSKNTEYQLLHNDFSEERLRLWQKGWTLEKQFELARWFRSNRAERWRQQKWPMPNSQEEVKTFVRALQDLLREWRALPTRKAVPKGSPSPRVPVPSGPKGPGRPPRILSRSTIPDRFLPAAAGREDDGGNSLRRSPSSTQQWTTSKINSCAVDPLGKSLNVVAHIRGGDARKIEGRYFSPDWYHTRLLDLGGAVFGCKDLDWLVPSRATIKSTTRASARTMQEDEELLRPTCTLFLQDAVDADVSQTPIAATLKTHCRLVVRAPIPEIWERMIRADALIIGHSNFHHAPALFSCGIVVYPAVTQTNATDRLTLLESAFWERPKWWSDAAVNSGAHEGGLRYEKLLALRRRCEGEVTPSPRQ